MAGVVQGRVLTHEQRPQVHQRALDLTLEDLDLVLQRLDSLVVFRHAALPVRGGLGLSKN
jgi:hypothetical protein